MDATGRMLGNFSSMRFKDKRTATFVHFPALSLQPMERKGTLKMSFCIQRVAPTDKQARLRAVDVNCGGHMSHLFGKDLFLIKPITSFRGHHGLSGTFRCFVNGCNGGLGMRD